MEYNILSFTHDGGMIAAELRGYGSHEVSIVWKITALAGGVHLLLLL